MGTGSSVALPLLQRVQRQDQHCYRTLPCPVSSESLLDLPVNLIPQAYSHCPCPQLCDKVSQKLLLVVEQSALFSAVNQSIEDQPVYETAVGLEMVVRKMPFHRGVHESSGRLAEKEVNCCEVEVMRPYSECKFPPGTQDKPDRITMQEEL